MVRENLKWCPKCKSFKDFSEFHANTSKPDGLQSECKRCQAARGRKFDRVWDTVDNLLGAVIVAPINIITSVVSAITAPLRWVDRLIPKKG
jgi:hypothetical protein